MSKLDAHTKIKNSCLREASFLVGKQPINKKISKVNTEEKNIEARKGISG